MPEGVGAEQQTSIAEASDGGPSDAGAPVAASHLPGAAFRHGGAFDRESAPLPLADTSSANSDSSDHPASNAPSDSPDNIAVGLAVEPDALPSELQGDLPTGPEIEIAHEREETAADEANIPDPSLQVTGADTSAKPVRIAFKVDARATYDDNIFISGDHKESDFVFTVAPTFAVGIGDVRAEFRRAGLSTFAATVVDEAYEPRNFLFVRYTPTGQVFIDHGSENALNHNAAFEAQWKLAYLTLRSRSSFQTLSYPSVDVGGRVDLSVLKQDLSAIYDYSERTAFEFNLGAMLHDYSTQLDSLEVIAQQWINYEIGARTRVGVGSKLGYLDVDEVGGQTYEQVLARGDYSATDKISLTANGGLEFRQFEDSGDRMDPVFGLGLTYSPFYQSMIGVTASRSIINSAGTAGQDIVISNVMLKARQRFFRRYYLGLEASYQNSEYVDASSSSLADRSDDLISIQPSAKMDITKSAALEIGYLWRRNTSSLDSFTFTQNQVYLHLDILF